MSDEYWSVDLPGLTEEQATGLRDRLLPELQVEPIDPRRYCVRALDRRSVEFLIGQLQSSVHSGVLEPGDAQGARGLLADLQEWLAQAEPAVP